jgi:hypothetical protein
MSDDAVASHVAALSSKTSLQDDSTLLSSAENARIAAMLPLLFELAAEFERRFCEKCRYFRDN